MSRPKYSENVLELDRTTIATDATMKRQIEASASLRILDYLNKKMQQDFNKRRDRMSFIEKGLDNMIDIANESHKRTKAALDYRP